MSRKSRFPQSPRHILVYDQDWEWLMAEFGPQSLNPVGVGVFVRELVHLKVRELRAQQQQEQTQGAGAGATAGAGNK